MTHDSMCPITDPRPEWTKCVWCELILAVRIDDRKNHNRRAMYMYGHDDGYAAAKEFYTNDCFFCGYSGEWSITACDECLSKEENKWFKERSERW